MIKNQARLFVLGGLIGAATALSACGGNTNPESNYSALINQSVRPSNARGAADQYMCGMGFVIQARGHGDTNDLHFTSGTSTSYTIELIKPLATNGMSFELEAKGPQGSSFSANDGSQDPTLAGTYTFTWTPPTAGQNSTGLTRDLRIVLKKKGDETLLDANIKNCLDKSVTPVDFNLMVDGAGQGFDVSVEWPSTASSVEEGASVPFSIVVKDDTATSGKHPHLLIGKVSDPGNELNAEDGSTFVTCSTDDQAVNQAGLWIYSCAFAIKSGKAPKQSNSHKTEQYVPGQVIVGYRIVAQSADGKQKSDFNDRRTVTLNPAAIAPTEKK